MCTTAFDHTVPRVDLRFAVLEHPLYATEPGHVSLESNPTSVGAAVDRVAPCCRPSCRARPCNEVVRGGCNAPNGFGVFYTFKSVRRSAGDDGSGQLEDSLRETFVAEVKREKPAVEVRVQMYPEMYAEVDRLKVEAELRMSVCWTLILLCVLLALTWSPLALAGLVGQLCCCAPVSSATVRRLRRRGVH